MANLGQQSVSDRLPAGIWPSRDRVRKRALLALAFALCSPGLAFGQVVARQAPPPTGETEFKSPAVLGVPLPSLKLLPARSEYRVKGISGIFVNDAEVQSLVVRRGKTKRGMIPFQLDGVIRVRPSHDKEIHIKASILAPNGQVLAVVASPRRFEAEEKKQTPFVLRLSVLESAALGIPESEQLRLELLINSYGPSE